MSNGSEYDVSHACQRSHLLEIAKSSLPPILSFPDNEPFLIDCRADYEVILLGQCTNEQILQASEHNRRWVEWQGIVKKVSDLETKYAQRVDFDPIAKFEGECRGVWQEYLTLITDE